MNARPAMRGSFRMGTSLPQGVRLLLFTPLVLAGIVRAQTPTAPSDATGTDDQVVKLSPFSVSSDREYGYRASNSIAGTRTNTPIKDIPVNIQVFTKELSDDLLITNQVDLERYNAALVNGGADPHSDNPIQQQYNQFLFRGFVQNWGLRDGIRQYDPLDTQGLSRVEVVKGPVAALYGLSYAGGVMNNVTKEVDFARNFTSIRLTGQNEGGYRGTIDANFSAPLHDGHVGVRFNGVHSVSEDQRAHSEGGSEYSQIITTWAPTENTQLSFLAETGYREKPNGLSYFTRPEQDAQGQSIDNGASVPLQIVYPNIPWDWNWADGVNMRSLDVSFYRGSIQQAVGENLNVTAYWQYSTRKQIDGNGWDANGSGGADSWEAGGGWTTTNGVDTIQAGYSYRDWSNNMHSYGATAVYKLDFEAVKNTFTFGANAWGERFVSRAGRQFVRNDAQGNPIPLIRLEYPIQAGINIHSPSAPPNDFAWDDGSLPGTSGNGFTRERNSNDYYYVSWMGSLIDDRLKLSAAVNRTNLELLQWSNGIDPTPNITKVSETSPMFGAVFAVTEQVSLFLVSGTSLFPSTDKNSFGTQMPPETGESIEGGVKFDLIEGKLSGTISYYDITKEGGGKQVSPAENFNTQRWDSLSPTERLTAFPSGTTRASLLSAGDFFPAGEQESKGFEIDLTWQPTRNLQLLLSMAHNDNEVSSSPIAADIGRKTIGSIENQYALLAKYTFSDGPLARLSLGLGVQKSDEALQDYNGPGGAARYNPDTFYLETFAGYRFKLWGYDSLVQLNLKNLTRQEEFVGWRATGSPTIRSTTRYEAPTEIQYNLTFGIDL